MHLKLKSISHQFVNSSGSIQVLNDVYLEIKDSEFVSVLGPSGCGKSTLLNLIAGLLKPAGGQMLLDHQPIPHAQSQVAYMQQKDLLLPWRRALSNAMLGAQLNKADLHKAEQEARELFQQFDLAGYEDRYPAELSGGMRQRVALVRTLLTHRPLWLLDEPFGALDTLTRMHLQDWMLKAWQEFQKSILMVTHDLDEALMLSDRIYVLTPRPATINAIYEVKLSRPRDRMSVEFTQAKQELWNMLSEVLSENA